MSTSPPTKPKVPENLPKGYYFWVRPSLDRYGRDMLEVRLYRSRRFWFDEHVLTEVDHVLPWNITKDVEDMMRQLVKKLLANLDNEKYIYGRHP